MTNYREILRLRNLGLNHSQIAESTATSRPTVITVLQRAVGWDLVPDTNLSLTPTYPNLSTYSRSRSQRYHYMRN